MTTTSEPRRIYWYRRQKGFFKTPIIKKLRKIAGGDTYVIIYEEMMDLSIDHQGYIHYQGIEPDIVREVALILDEDYNNVAAVWTILERVGEISQVSDTQWGIPYVIENIGSEAQSTKRVREFRDRQKALKNGTISEDHQIAENPQKSTSYSTSQNDVLALQALHCNTDETKCNKSVTTDKRREEERREEEIRKEEIREEHREIEASPWIAQKPNNLFQIFSSQYPKTINERNQRFVEAAWSKVAAGRENEIICALYENIHGNDAWKTEGGRYIPSAENWLLNEGWKERFSVYSSEEYQELLTLESDEQIERCVRMAKND